MADVTITPNMNLPVPVPSVAPGPEWANSIVADMNAIDSHDHTTGKGVPITPEGLNVNAELPLNDNNLTEAKSVRFWPQSAPLGGASDLGCIYEVDDDLYYNDGAGNQIRITQGGSVTGSSGTITGLPSGTASASFSAGTFTFQSATNTPATMAVGPLVIGRSAAASKTVTLAPNAGQASDYGVTFPSALPASTNYTTLDNSGNISYNTSGSTGTGAVVLASSPTITNPTFSGDLSIADGSAADPSVAFASDTDTGIYKAASNALGISANGLPALRVSDTGTGFLGGASTDPSITFIADPDTGVYRPSSNVVGIAAGGVAAASVGASSASFAGSLETASGGAFKVKIITVGSGTTSGTVTAAHGLTGSNILTALPGYWDATGSQGFGPGTGDVGTIDFICFWDATNVGITWQNGGSNSKTWKATILYQ